MNFSNSNVDQNTSTKLLQRMFALDFSGPTRLSVIPWWVHKGFPPSIHKETDKKANNLPDFAQKNFNPSPWHPQSPPIQETSRGLEYVWKDYWKEMMWIPHYSISKWMNMIPHPKQTQPYVIGRICAQFLLTKMKKSQIIAKKYLPPQMWLSKRGSFIGPMLTLLWFTMVWGTVQMWMQNSVPNCGSDNGSSRQIMALTPKQPKWDLLPNSTCVFIWCKKCIDSTLVFYTWFYSFKLFKSILCSFKSSKLFYTLLCSFISFPELG